MSAACLICHSCFVGFLLVQISKIQLNNSSTERLKPRAIEKGIPKNIFSFYLLEHSFDINSIPALQSSIPIYSAI